MSLRQWALGLVGRGSCWGGEVEEEKKNTVWGWTASLGLVTCKPLDQAFLHCGEILQTQVLIGLLPWQVCSFFSHC